MKLTSPRSLLYASLIGLSACTGLTYDYQPQTAETVAVHHTQASADSLLPEERRFLLRSPTLGDRTRLSPRQLFNGFGCQGENLAPALEWQAPPEGTRSFAITVYDPDAPTGSGWWHWLVTDLPADVRALPEGAGIGNGLPIEAREFRTDFGTSGFGGACPPPGHGEHRYIFTLHALKVDRLALPDDASAALVGFQLWANRLASTSFTVTYGR